MQTRLLDSADVSTCADLAEIVDAVEGAFGAYARGNVQMPAKSYIDLPQYDGDFRSMPAYIDARGSAGERDWEGAGIKWVNSHPKNPARHDLPTVMGTMIYSDPETAFPLAIMDGTTLTRLRTGAAAAVATAHLARTDAHSLGLVGAGVQAHAQLEAIALVRDIRTVVAADLDEAAIEALTAAYGDDYEIRRGTVDEAASRDVVSTTTPVEEPIVTSVPGGTHVNAMGADAAGKHEIADQVLQNATIVIDDYEQCTHSGEINVPWRNGVLTDADIHAELGAVVAGEAPGRTSSDEVTVFDSTGLAIQDVAAAHVVFTEASERDIGSKMSLVGTET